MKKQLMILFVVLLTLFISCNKKEEKISKTLLKKEQIQKITEIQKMVKLSDQVLNKEVTDKETIQNLVEYFKDEEVIEFLKSQGFYHAIDRTIDFIEVEYLTGKNQKN